MAIHDWPRCWVCVEVIDYDPIFAAACDHETCPSVAFHGLCLMEWREYREKRVQAFQKWVDQHQQEQSERSED